MLKSLSIKNIAIIELLDIEFSDGLNVLTGETGAGKSIVVGGLELALGERASAEAVRSGEKLAVVEASFEPPFPPQLEDVLLNQLELEYQTGESLLLRREISSAGRSRCFIGEQMVGVADLKAVGELLVDLHGQHEHQSLFHTSAHLTALDAFASHDKLREEYSRVWKETEALRQRKLKLEQEAANFDTRIDYMTFQIKEIEKIDPKPGEMAELAKEEKRLAHAESLSQAAWEAQELLEEGINGEQIPLLDQIGELIKRISEIAEVETNFSKILSSLEESQTAFEDLTISLRDFAENTRADPKRLNEVITRLNALNALIRKHGGSEESLFADWEHIQAELDRMTRDDEEREKITEKFNRAEARLLKLGEELSRKRKKTAESMRKKILSMLRQMAMKKSDFSIAIDILNTPGSRGLDHVEFFLAANPGLPPAPLRKVASGGELSRVMLAIKSVLAERDAIPTLVFDEIDAGISGDICRRIGEVLEELSQSHQIVCITHHAAIAARADVHMSVRKSTSQGKTTVDLAPLDGQERLEELARMMGGQDIQAALTLARQLMK